MKRVYSSENAIDVWQIKNLLEVAGIKALVKNAGMYSAFGEIPSMESWPEVWVERPVDYERARDIVDEYFNGEEDCRPDWRCPGCRQKNGAAFGVCWNCQQPAPSLA